MDGVLATNLRRVPAGIDGLRVLKLVVINGLRLWRLVWPSLFAQSRLCQVVLRRATVVAPTSDPPESREIHPLIHEPSPVMRPLPIVPHGAWKENSATRAWFGPTAETHPGNVAAGKSLAMWHP